MFDSEGQELDFDDDDDNNVGGDSTADSLLNFVAERSGKYYVGVSSHGNSDYDVVQGSNNFNTSAGLSSGNYDLAINIASVVADRDPDNTIFEAIDVDVSSSGQRSTIISDSISSESDVDIYQFQLDQGHTISLDIDAAELNTGLDSVLRLFDADGNQLNTNDDAAAPDENPSTDSLIEFTASNTGNYYVGVSSFANFSYDPINGSTNITNDIGSSTGNYDLVIDLTDSL